MLRADLRSTFVFLLLFTGIQVFAQINDPFSRYGIGNLRDYEFTINQGMGSMSSAFSNPRYINTANPASYADFYSEQYAQYLDVKTFDSTYTDSATGEEVTKTFRDSVYKDTMVGKIKNTSFQSAIDLQFYNTIDQNSEVRTSNGSIGYFAMGFPIPNFGGISIGVLPYSRVNYNVTRTETRDSIGRVDFAYEGSGGLYQFYTGGAFKLKNLKVGLNARYIFGSIELTNTILLNEQTNAFGTRSTSQISVDGIALDVGLQYNIILDKNLNLQVGGFGKLPTTVSAKADSVLESVFINASGATANLDTIRQNVEASTEFTIPAGFGVGFVLEEPGSWLFGMDYKTDRWQGQTGFLSNTELNSSWKLSAGGQIIPELSGNFLERLHYRLGAYYSQTNMQVNGNEVLDYGMTFGLGLPIIRQRESPYSTIDLSVQVGQIGNMQNNIVSENYVKLSLGFNMNDNSWIFKSKFY